MAEISCTRDHDPYGDVEYCVEWEDNRGAVREKYFRTRREAERFALDVERELLIESVAKFQEWERQMSHEERRAFKEMIASGSRPQTKKTGKGKAK